MREIASRSWAVVGLEPVDPSAMTGSPFARAFQMLDLRREQPSLPLSPVNHAALFKNERPLPQGDAQKSRRNGPILVEGFARQAIDC